MRESRSPARHEPGLWVHLPDGLHHSEDPGSSGTSGGTGGLKRYAYDPCAAVTPPPYFPTTGHFAKGQYYQVSPVNFSVAAYYDRLTAG